MTEREAAGRVADGWPRDVAACLFLALFPAVFLRELPGWLPPYGGDVEVHVYPLLSLLAHGLHEGRPVLWNTYAAGGYPLAPYSALSLYPPVAAALLAWPLAQSIAALYAAFLAVLGLGMYALGGDLGLSRPARLLSACSLAYGGFMAAHVYAGHLFELGSVCLMPLAFLLLRRAILRERVLPALWCGAAIGAMVLAAGAQFLPFALAPLPALTLWHLGLRVRAARRSVGGRLSRSRPPARRIWLGPARPLGALAIAAVVAALVGAAYLVPFAEILGATLRAAALPYADAAAQSLPWGGLTLFVAPDAFGNPLAATYWPASRTQPYFHEIYAYAGLAPLLLAAPALWRRPASRPYGVLAVLALLVMLGYGTPVYWAVYHLHLPGADLFRAPARAGLVVDFALAVLAGFGLDALCTPAGFGLGTRRVPVEFRLGTLRAEAKDGARSAARLLAPPAVALLAVAVGLSVAAQAGFIIPARGRDLALWGAARLTAALLVALLACLAVARERRLALVLPALACLDLYSANGALFAPADPARYFRPTAALGAVAPNRATYRFLARDGSIPLGEGMVRRDLYDVQDPAPLALAAYWRLSHPDEVRRSGGRVVVTGRDTIREVDPFFLRLFGVRTVLSDSPLRVPGLRLSGRVAAPRWTLPGGADWNMHRYVAPSLVYRNADALPRAFTGVTARTVRDEGAALRLLRGGTVDPRRTVILSPSGAAPPAWLLPIQRDWADWLAGAAENTVNVTADGGHAGTYLVVDDGWFPGWTATVDGRAADVLRADYLLKAVRVPPGRHRVRLVYAPLSYLAGALLTIASALGVLSLALARLLMRLGDRRQPDA